MKLTMGAGSLPAGVYSATFVGVEKYEDNADKYGEGLKWTFRVTKGDHEGGETSRITSKSISKKSAAGKLLSQLAGRQIEAGEEITTDQYVGQAYVITVEETDSGSTRVASVLHNT